MGYKEVNDKNRARLQGQAGVYRVASELLLRGLNPMFPAVDCGADLIVEGGVRIQVKCAHLRKSNGAYDYRAYWFKLARGPYVSGNSTIHKRAARKFSEECEFVVFWGIEENRFWVVPSDLLDNKHLVVIGPDIGWRDLNLDELKALYDQGKTQSEIAEHFGVSEATISRRLKGDYVMPVTSRGTTYRVRGCESRWDYILITVGRMTGEVLQDSASVVQESI